MTCATLKIGDRWHRLPRILMATNFFLFLLLISPLGTSHELYRRFEGTLFANVVGHSLQLWFVGSTLVATILPIVHSVRKRNVGDASSSRYQLIDFVLISLWWIVVIGTCLYALALGAGG